MSGILAFTKPARAAVQRAARRALAPLGGDRSGTWENGGVTLTATRKEWELAPEFSANVLILETPRVIIAADAAIYERDALLRALRSAGVVPEALTPTHLIAAAYDAWGEDLVQHLRGDYAFVLWDSSRQRLVAGRDAIGSRPLYYASGEFGIVAGSSSLAVAEIAGASSNLDHASLGTQVAGFAWAMGSHTAFRGVHPLLPGHVATADHGVVCVRRFWQPADAVESSPLEFGAAAEELRTILRAAVLDRLTPGTNSVWMSGGWDSTAVFAAGQDALAESGRARLRPVSISYPENDPGCEDTLIRDVAQRWNAEVHWLQSDDIPLLEDIESRAARADEPPAHLYELWNRALAQGTRAVGARVALDGGGGDQLFQVSDVVIAESLRRGNFRESARLARARRRYGWRHLFRAGVLPLVPPSILEAGEEFSGRRLPRHYLERPHTSWVRQDFVARHGLRERDHQVLRVTRSRSLAHNESMLYLAAPVWAYGASFMRGALLNEGVEARSPLLDLRVVEFALRRPIRERSSGAETKSLLRAAMRGLLPEKFLAPRSHRTGMTIGFSQQRMRAAYPRLWERVFASPLLLAEMGIVDPRALKAAVQECLAGRVDENVRVNLYHTLKAELWLRGRDSHSAGSAQERTLRHRMQTPAA